MLRMPVNRINTFIEELKEEGKEVICINRPITTLNNLLALLAYTNSEGTHIQLFDTWSLCLVGVPVCVVEGVVEGKSKPSIFRNEPKFGTGIPKLGKRGRFIVHVDKDNRVEDFYWNDFWCLKSSVIDSRKPYPLDSSTPYGKQMHSLMKSIIMRDRLLMDLEHYILEDEVLEDSITGLKELVSNLNKTILRLVDSYVMKE